MSTSQVFNNVIDARLLPTLITLRKNLVAASFSLMKIIPAKFMLDQAASDGRLKPKGRIIETSSGTFGLALAMICSLRKYDLTLVSDPAIDKALGLRIRDLGARLEIVDKPSEKGGFQQARLDLMHELQRKDPSQFWPSQYNNVQNAGAYAPVAELLIDAFAKVDCLVGTVGSGGSMSGTGKYLRGVLPKLTMIGVDTMNSILFGQPDGPRLLRGLGNSIMPQNLDHTLFDEVHWVTAAEAFCATRTLHRDHALYMGGTSGAAYLVASWWAQQNPKKKVVVLLPDEGHRYATSIYDDEALKKLDAWIETIPAGPQQVNNPAQELSTWSYMKWGRKSLLEVLAQRSVAQN